MSLLTRGTRQVTTLRTIPTGRATRTTEIALLEALLHSWAALCAPPCPLLLAVRTSCWDPSPTLRTASSTMCSPARLSLRWPPLRADTAARSFSRSPSRNQHLSKHRPNSHFIRHCSTHPSTHHRMDPNKHLLDSRDPRWPLSSRRKSPSRHPGRRPSSSLQLSLAHRASKPTRWAPPLWLLLQPPLPLPPPPLP